MAAEAYDKYALNWIWFIEEGSRALYCRRGNQWIKYKHMHRMRMTRGGHMMHTMHIRILQYSDRECSQRTTITMIEENISGVV